jgi:hypothetical protein
MTCLKISSKLKFLEIAKNLKKDNITYDEAIQQVKNIDAKEEFICCDNIILEKTINRYPSGLPLDTIEILYCTSCHRIHNIEW